MCGVSELQLAAATRAILLACFQRFCRYIRWAHLLGRLASDSGRVTKGAWVEGALRGLSVALCKGTASLFRDNLHAFCLFSGSPLCGVVGLRWGAEVTRLCVCLFWFPALVPACVYWPCFASVCNKTPGREATEQTPQRSFLYGLQRWVACT